MGAVVVATAGDERQPVRIVGVVRYPFALFIPALTTTRAFGERYRAALEDAVEGEPIYNAIVRLRGGPGAIPEFQRAFAALTGRNDVESRDLHELVGKLDQGNAFEALILSAIAVAALVAALALLGQTAARYAAGSSADLRVLRTAGLRPGRRWSPPSAVRRWRCSSGSW